MKRIALIFAVTVACAKAPPVPAPVAHADPPVAHVVAIAPSSSAKEPEPEQPAVVERIDVKKDAQASLVRGSHTHIAFMPGLCSNAYAYMLGFPEAARAHGGVVAIEGDTPCEGAPGFRSFTWSTTLQKARIEAAFAAANVPIPDEGITLVGYSAGASIAEMMHHAWPKLFPKLVLIAPPMAPKIDRLRSAKGVIAMSCSLDVPYLMKAAAKSLGEVHVPATYMEMPKCTHGQLADGERVFGEAFDWLDHV
jgi:pimeloyl-ACP methyl ester carboxylesterase